MKDPIHVAFLWHHHQPYYRDDRTGETVLPWVRMHGVKDYTGLALILQEFPELACTINLVPSLLAQIQAYAGGGPPDRFEVLASIPPADLDVTQRAAVVEGFFWAHPAHLVGAFPRYRELHELRRGAGRTAAEASAAFGDQDLLDLTVLWNLAWCHRLLRERDPFLRGLVAKGGGYSLEDRRALHARQREILAGIIPLHRELAGTGRVELSTSPWYHPILPLLCRPADARAALPDLSLPRGVRPVPEDAAEQLRRAVELHTELFGTVPAGLWPPEGSVSDAMAGLVAEAGFRWMASDEEILSLSLGRDCRGRGGRDLYRPWKLPTGGGRELAVFFRDHRLSDKIGFEYQHAAPEPAAEDLVARIKALRGGLRGGADKSPALVCLILDGENPWESYPEGGVPFLRRLFELLCSDPGVRTTTFSAWLDEHPPQEAMQSIFPGSWIRHDFAIWIGHPEDRRAWQLLHEARDALVAALSAGELSPEAARAALEEVYQAEGSDWYWWFGEEHHAQTDSEFDRLFRQHLKNIYALIGKPAPEALDAPIKRPRVERAWTLPTDYLSVQVDGRITDFFEWKAAGHYRCGVEAGAMDRAAAGAVTDLRYGYDQESLFLRCDLVADAAGSLQVQIQGAGVDAVTLGLPLGRGPQDRPLGPTQADQPVSHAWAVDRIAELSLPLAALQAKPGDELGIQVSHKSPDGTVRHYPADAPLRLPLPTRDLRRTHWVV